jgi:hypothetical protein
VPRTEARSAGFGALSYQWRRNGTPLSDGGPISGSATATLTIDPAAFTDAASYDVLVTDACGSIASSPGTLAVEFADVPVDNPFHADIITVATDGITAGWRRQLLPRHLVRRDQMAVFSQVRARVGLPPPAAPASSPTCPSAPSPTGRAARRRGRHLWMRRHQYRPGNSVTRAQMAVFLLKTSLGSAYAPPVAPASPTSLSAPSLPITPRTLQLRHHRRRAPQVPCSTAPATPSTAPKWLPSS